MEKITGMKITRDRPGRKMQEPPRELDFYNSEGEVVLSIHFTQHSKEMYIFPRGAEVTIYDNENWPLFLNETESGDTKFVTTGDWEHGTRLFPVKG